MSFIFEPENFKKITQVLKTAQITSVPINAVAKKLVERLDANVSPIYADVENSQGLTFNDLTLNKILQYLENNKISLTGLGRIIYSQDEFNSLPVPVQNNLDKVGNYFINTRALVEYIHYLQTKAQEQDNAVLRARLATLSQEINQAIGSKLSPRVQTPDVTTNKIQDNKPEQQGEIKNQNSTENKSSGNIQDYVTRIFESLPFNTRTLDINAIESFLSQIENFASSINQSNDNNVKQRAQNLLGYVSNTRNDINTLNSYLRPPHDKVFNMTNDDPLIFVNHLTDRSKYLPTINQLRKILYDTSQVLNEFFSLYGSRLTDEDQRSQILQQIGRGHGDNSVMTFAIRYLDNLAHPSSVSKVVGPVK